VSSSSVLVINSGSSSIKYQLVDPETGELMDSSNEGASMLRVLDAVQIDPEYARAASAALTSLATAALSVPVEGAEVSQLRGDRGDESSESAATELSTELPETTLPEPCAAELRELGIRPAIEMIEPLSEDAAALAGIDEHALARVTAALGERLAGVLFAPDAASAEQALHLLAENTLAGQRTMWRIFDPAGTEHTRYSLLYPAEGASPLELAAAYRAASQVVTRTRAELDEAEQTVQQAQTAAESAVEAEREAAKAAGVASAEHARARAQAESLEASAQNIQAERARLNERLTAAEESVTEARTAYESARTREDAYLVGTGEQAPAAKIERRAQRLGEVLAEQHLRSVLDILGDMAAPEDSDADDSAAGSAEGAPAGSGEEPCRVRVRLLTASMGTRAKRKVLQELADGTAQIVIGTHALLSDEVSFHDLGLVVVDEQHRFGVEQRDSLRGTDGALPHRLVMTATPIPRTVAMTVFGDLDVSVLDTLPVGRQKISTHVVPLAEKPAWASRLWRRAREEIDAGHQVYVVVPKIGEDGDSLEEGTAFFGASSLNGAGAGNSAQGYFGQGGSVSSDGKVQLTSVASMYSYLSAEDALVGVRIGTLHGRMDPAEKTAVMTAFERGEIDLLISTTVIEVGVNVPNATLMIIMDADRFGISGLHQLRGRVGRGGYAGTCLLVTRQEEGGVSRERLDAVASTTDGFELSRIDLAQRREGDILGAAQSGSKSTLRFLRALADADIIERAREDARSVVEKDPTLAKHPSLARTIDRALDADREAFLGRG